MDRLEERMCLGDGSDPGTDRIYGPIGSWSHIGFFGGIMSPSVKLRASNRANDDLVQGRLRYLGNYMVTDHL